MQILIDTSCCILNGRNMCSNDYRVSKKNDATFNRNLFLYYNHNWYAFNIYY